MKLENSQNYIIFGLNNGYEYAKEVSEQTGIKLGEFEISKFADGEILVRSESTVRGMDVVVFQSTSAPVNDNLMELFIAIDSLKRSSANSITVVIPYYGYARQDRKAKGREPITCKLVANFLENSGATKVILLDIHALQTQGFFDIPVDTVSASCILFSEYKKQNPNLENLTIVAPDYGAVKKVRKVSEILDVSLAIVDKRRPKPNVVEVSNVLGEVLDRDCLLIDDMIDTGGTILKNIDLLKDKGAKKITVMATHGVFSNNAIDKFIKFIDEGKIDGLYISDSIEANRQIKHPKIHVVKLANFFRDIIDAQINHSSVSNVYDKYWTKVLCQQKKG